MELKATILIVDDEPELRENIALARTTAGYQVLTTGDGAEALNLLQVQPVELILADAAMPNVNGYQLYEQISKIPRLAMPLYFSLPANLIAIFVMANRWGLMIIQPNPFIRPICWPW